MYSAKTGKSKNVINTYRGIEVKVPVKVGNINAPSEKSQKLKRTFLKEKISNSNPKVEKIISLNAVKNCGLNTGTVNTILRYL